VYLDRESEGWASGTSDEARDARTCLCLSSSSCLWPASGPSVPRNMDMSATMQASDRRFRVLIAEDQPIIRGMVRSTLEKVSHLEVCAEAEDGGKAIELAQRLKPDVVVLNVTMPVLNGFEAAREIRAILPEIAIVILSTHADRVFVEAAKKIGVRSYIAKSKAGEVLVKAIEAAVKGDDFVLIE
jgi:CheY-like chemotaxis protein